jgi:nitrate/nitrite transporter NarK
VSEGLIAVILLYSSASIVAGFFVLAFVPEDPADGSLVGGGMQSMPRGQLLMVLRMPAVWLQAFIILIAYWLYIGTFEFATFGEKAFDQDKVFGATLGAFREWLRPMSAIAAGFLADRIRPTRAVALAFVISAVGYAVLAGLPGDADLLWMLWIQVATVAIAVFALRGIYFALMEESQVPLMLTGTVVGLISTIGYTPDIFAYPLVGWLIDNFGAALGYQYYFTLLACTACIGLFLTLALAWFNLSKRTKSYA